MDLSVITTFHLISYGIVYVSMQSLYLEPVQWTTLSLKKLHLTLNLLTKSTHCTSDWWSCFSLLSVAPAEQYILHAGCVLLCCFIVITALVIYLILSPVLEVEWGHVGSFTGISREWFGCSPTAALTSIRGGIFFFFSITPVVPTVPSAPLDTLRHIWAAHPATMVTEEFY